MEDPCTDTCYLHSHWPPLSLPSPHAFTAEAHAPWLSRTVCQAINDNKVEVDVS